MALKYALEYLLAFEKHWTRSGLEWWYGAMAFAAQFLNSAVSSVPGHGRGFGFTNIGWWYGVAAGALSAQQGLEWRYGAMAFEAQILNSAVSEHYLSRPAAAFISGVFVYQS